MKFDELIEIMNNLRSREMRDEEYDKLELLLKQHELFNFPHGRRDDIYYHDLDPANKQIVLKHLKIDGELMMWDNIRDYLIEQIHQKKSTRTFRAGCVTYKISHATCQYYYRNYLFAKRRVLSSIDFPGAFKSRLENVLIRELTTPNFNYITVYYNEDAKPDELKFSHYDQDEWLLSDGPEMSENDVSIMEKYKMGFITLLVKCTTIVQEFEEDIDNRCRRETKRIMKAMNFTESVSGTIYKN